MTEKQTNFHAPDPRQQGDGDGNDAREVGPGTGDMLKSVYDTNDDGRVNSADHANTATTADDLAAPSGFFLYYGRDDLGNLGFHALPFSRDDIAAFVDLSDVPSSYTGQAGLAVLVNGTEDGLEFGTPTAGGQQLTTKTTADTGELPSWAAWIADTTSSALTRAMPSSPSDGEEVTAHDINGNAATNNITLTVVGPTTINEPVINLDNQSKKWRYDSTGDVWDLVFSDTPSVGGGGGGVGVTVNAITIVNPDAETGDTTGWTDTSGGIGVRDSDAGGTLPYEGTYWFDGGNSGLSEAYQDIDFTTYESNADIDTGELYVILEWQQSCFDESDQARMEIIFLDNVDAEISRFTATSKVVNNNVWQKRSLRGFIPANTRTLRLVMEMDRTSGSVNNGYIDAIVCDYFKAAP